MKQLVLRNTLYERIYRSLGVVCIVMVIFTQKLLDSILPPGETRLLIVSLAA